MKKIVSLKIIIITLLAIALLGMNMVAFATDGVFDTNNAASNQQPTAITTDDYSNAATIPVDTNYATGNTTENTSNNVSTGINTSSAYNTVDEEEEDLPQTGIEDYNVGILLVVCIAASIYTYKKMKDYKNI